MGKDLISLGKRYGIPLFISLDVFWFLLPVPWWQVLLGIVAKSMLWRGCVLLGKLLRPHYQLLQIRQARQRVRRQRTTSSGAPPSPRLIAKIRRIGNDRRYDAN